MAHQNSMMRTVPFETLDREEQDFVMRKIACNFPTCYQDEVCRATADCEDIDKEDAVRNACELTAPSSCPYYESLFGRRNVCILFSSLPTMTLSKDKASVEVLEADGRKTILPVTAAARKRNDKMIRVCEKLPKGGTHVHYVSAEDAKDMSGFD